MHLITPAADLQQIKRKMGDLASFYKDNIQDADLVKLLNYVPYQDSNVTDSILYSDSDFSVLNFQPDPFLVSVASGSGRAGRR